MRRICSHHIGGRAGSRAFPVLPEFEKDLVNLLYDADRDCIAQIENRNKHLESELRVLPYCVGAEHADEVTFNINYDPFASSLRNMNEKYASWYFYLRRDGYDYIMKDALKTVEKRKQQMMTLDEILEDDPTVMPPDIFTLDAQGMEYEFLQGAHNAINSSVLAVITEVEFHPLYQGQKLFGDVFSLLTEQGFEFVQFTKDFLECSPFRKSIGLRGEGFLTCTDALFFKNLDCIDDVEETSKRAVMLDKMAFISIIFNQLEYGMECLKRRGALAEESHLQEYAYVQMLRRIESAADKMDKTFPPVFSDIFTAQGSRKSSSPDSNNNDQPDNSKQYGYDEIDVETFADSEIEQILNSYGLTSQAEVVKRRRIRQSESI